MSSSKFKAINCRISRGGFSDERVFLLSLPEGEYSGVASHRYLWNSDGSPLKEGEPPHGEVIEGSIAVRVVEVFDSGGVLVSLPDGEVIQMPVTALIDRPTAVGQHVPIGS